MSTPAAVSVLRVDPSTDIQSVVFRPSSELVVTIPYNKSKLIFQTPYSWMQIQVQYTDYRNEIKYKTIVLPRGRSLLQTTDWPRKRNTCMKIQAIFYENRVKPLESHLPKLILYMPRTARNRQSAYVYIVNPRDAETYTEYLNRN
jgi:hypothetical protein